MCEPLTEDRGADQLTFFAEDFHAKTYQQPPLFQEPRESALMESAAVYGRSIGGLLRKFSLAQSLLKTPRFYAQGDWDESCPTLPGWGMMHDGSLLELGTLEQCIDGIDFGCWATPLARDFKDYPSGKKIRNDGKSRIDGLPRQVYSSLDGSGLFTPPTAMATWMSPLPAPDAVKTTPNADAPAQQWTPNTTTSYATVSNTHGQEQIGLLNAEFSEWLMGWPIGWTDLKPLEMDKCRNARLWHGGYLPESE
jgi:hypothetical protein